MLKIRFSRAGRKGSAFFRIVLTEHTKSAKNGYMEKLGWYNPHTKECEVDTDRIKAKMAHGVQLSPSVAKMFKKQNISV